MDDSVNLVHKILENYKYFDNINETKKLVSKNKLLTESFRFEGNSMLIQEKHDLKEHRKLIYQFTSGIAFAHDSEDLLKGFIHRSLALNHLHLYEEALIDIDRALKLTKSEDLKAKLESRREGLCFKLKEKCKNKKCPDELPKIEPSKIIPNASEAASIKYSKRFGRHLIATRDIKPGEVIISEDSYTCIPKEGRVYEICSHCIRFSWNGIPCDTCAWAIFCSEECKKEAWQEYHDVECPIISLMLLHFKDNFLETMLPLRLFIKAVKREGFMCVMNEIEKSNDEQDNIQKLLSDGVLDSKKFRSYYNLESHAQDEQKHLDFDNALVIVTLLIRHTTIIPISNDLEQMDSTGNKLLLTLTEALMRLRNILSCNTVKYKIRCPDKEGCKGLYEDNGSLIAATCSLINHSCCPNVSKIFLPKRKIVIYAIASIKKDQPLCDSYGPVFSLKKEKRQKYLEENYHFLCSCQACEENWPQDIGLGIVKNSIVKSSAVDMFMEEFKSYYPNDKSSPENIITQFINQSYYEKATLEKVLKLCDLLYKYFDYRIAYYHSHLFLKCIEKSFLRLYGGDEYVMPKDC